LTILQQKHLKMSAMRRPQKKITTEIQGFVSQPVAMSSFISKKQICSPYFQSKILVKYGNSVAVNTSIYKAWRKPMPHW
jgi:hypothetical protein